ncbi:alanine racemase [Dendronalium sp. ChiSLP03b]|uniref:alanine racemase n=1 Tax=Dendronalium sp. ChiSLP03b TaxID=3075381 RepID=UPI002AD1F232|nr:alanine racemase [Dendronalium sp. ChiSLP03b]MDZ8206779.1 alanine racemase [Dendronalium sp. ChiSLP03b]
MSIVVTVDLAKLQENIWKATKICCAQDLELVAVVKGLCGHINICRQIIQAGLTKLADSRLHNIKTLKQAGIDCEMTLLRPPSMDEIDDCITYVDTSFNVDLDVLRALSHQAQLMCKEHNVSIVFDADTHREGLKGNTLQQVCQEVLELPNLQLTGLAIYFAKKETDSEYFQKEAELVKQVRAIETEFGLSLPTVSVGSSGAFGSFVRTQQIPEGINQFRVGTGLLLGISSSVGPEYIEGFHHFVFTLQAEIMQIIHDGVKNRTAVLHMGRVDVELAGLIPTDELSVFDITSDHTMICLGERHADLAVGDKVTFGVNYYSLNRLFLSPYTQVVLV